MKSLKIINASVAFLCAVLFSAFAIAPGISEASAKTTEQSCIYNTVIYLSFNEEDDAFPDNFYSDMRQMFETASVSVPRQSPLKRISPFVIRRKFLPAKRSRTSTPRRLYSPSPLSWRRVKP